MRNMHPADELAMIRSDLQRLRAREEFLKNGFLSLRLPTRGDDAVATVKILKEKCFLRNKLPEHILENADYWETKITRHVVVDEPRMGAGRVPAFMAEYLDDAVVEQG